MARSRGPDGDRVARSLVRVTGGWSGRYSNALAATRREEPPGVEVVTYAPATTRGFEGGHQRTEVYRYAAPPPLDRYDIGERSFRVERVTRPLDRRMVNRRID